MAINDAQRLRGRGGGRQMRRVEEGRRGRHREEGSIGREGEDLKWRGLPPLPSINNAEQERGVAACSVLPISLGAFHRASRLHCRKRPAPCRGTA
ncbi:hypothetical protein [Oryza sativa Japonica Group]|uniref:Uncharacterized protein P0511C01.14 n=1 Tax=Oryza sativa subsp. japonica TaxID=39947 RepID=Q5NB13_ORYSJ|nr:hypothetical protein [Oryza sativa Japonica Group]